LDVSPSLNGKSRSLSSKESEAISISFLFEFKSKRTSLYSGCAVRQAKYRPSAEKLSAQKLLA